MVFVMNILNEKLRIMRVQLEMEKKKPNPNYQNIKKLQNELKSLVSCL